MAKEGILFRNAFVTAPSCTPCRSSLLSGQYFWRTGQGAILQGAKWDAKIPSFPLLLEKSGYHIGYTSKVWTPGTPVHAPYGGKAKSYDRKGSEINRFSQHVEKSATIQEGKEQLYQEVRGNFADFMADRKDNEPFCYWFGPTNCHRKWTQGSGKRHWGIDPDDLKGKLPPFLPDVPIVREDFADYLGEAQAFDAMLGVLIQQLESQGELENTLIVVSGDHGMPGMPQGKCNLYDFGVAVPLAIRLPKAAHGGRLVEDFVNLIDLAPTLLEIANEKPLDIMSGRSLVPLLVSDKNGTIDVTRDHVVVGRERHVAKARAGQLPYPQRAIRTKDYLYIRNFKPERWPMGSGPGMGAPAGPMPPFEKLRENTFVAFGDLDGSPTKAWLITHRDDPEIDRYFKIAFGRRPAEELYDLRKDPHQMTNVADQSNYEDTKAVLSGRMLSTLRNTGDPRIMGDGSTYDRPPFAGATQ